MKAIKLILIHFLFFFLILLITYLLEEYLIVKRTCFAILIIGLSLFIYNYLQKIDKVLKAFFVNLISLFLFFEIMKVSEYLLGLMPKYIENILVSMLASLISIVLYLGVIILLRNLVKRLNQTK